ncbi:Protease 2 [Quillaja saponaria]|uniref:Protease 2 n=1 Tax=Quillaja saponaria TaxID=32244 RepID=A0AAD7L784_QUISA|nr:Protease 2 [Quillaja saponaria]
MSSLNDKVAMHHMDVYTEAVMSESERLQSKLQAEMASRMASELSTPPIRWGPWWSSSSFSLPYVSNGTFLIVLWKRLVFDCRLYYRRVEEGKQYPVLCRRLAILKEEFISHKSPSAGFDFTSGKRIEQKVLDYNQEA